MAPCRTLRALQPGYAGISGRFKERFHSVNMGQGSDARAWLTGDFTGGGTTEIAQLWDNQGQLGMTFYRTDGKGGLKPWFSTGYIGASSAALAWLTGDFTGDGTTEIAQLWSDNGKAGDDPLRDRRQRRPQGTLWR